MQSPTVRRVVNAFFRWAESALAPNTVKAYRHQLKKFVKAVPNKQACRLKPIDLSTWAKTWHEVQAVIRLFNWAVDDARLLRENPFARCRLPARGQRRRILARRVLARVVRAATPAPRAYLFALRETLARPQEIRLATWEQLQSEDIDLPIDDALAAGKALIVQPDYKDARRRKDTSRPRVLLVSARLGRLILRLGVGRQDRTGPIFLNTKRKPWTRNAVRCLMRRLRRKLSIVADAQGEHLVAYTFRHSLATLAASRGVTDRTLADLLGHVETRTTTRYLHLNVGHLRAAFERFTSDCTNARRDAKRKL